MIVATNYLAFDIRFIALPRSKELLDGTSTSEKKDTKRPANLYNSKLK